MRLFIIADSDQQTIWSFLIIRSQHNFQAIVWPLKLRKGKTNAERNKVPSFYSRGICSKKIGLLSMYVNCMPLLLSFRTVFYGLKSFFLPFSLFPFTSRWNTDVVYARKILNIVMNTNIKQNHACIKINTKCNFSNGFEIHDKVKGWCCIKAILSC